MTVFVCVDDTMGMAFNGRRQSRDSAVVEDILRSCGGMPQMDGRSEKLFGEGGGDTSSASLHSAPSPQGEGLFGASGGGCADAYFMEFACEEEVLQKAERIVLYRWNRAYPADVKFTMPGGFTLKESRDFAGSSHEKITREEYTRET